MRPNECQVHSLQPMHVPLGRVQIVWQFRHRLKRMVRRRLNCLSNAMRRLGMAKEMSAVASEGQPVLQPGNRVRVRSRDEIRQTLDNWNELARCGFMEEMWEFCDTEQVIFKRVDRFLDERDYRVKRVRGIYLLEGLICGGTVDFGPCDRSCFFFWREEWLEKQ